MDDAYCLFVTARACSPDSAGPAQPLFALLAFGLAVTALTSAGQARPTRPTQTRRAAYRNHDSGQPRGIVDRRLARHAYAPPG